MRRSSVQPSRYLRGASIQSISASMSQITSPAVRPATRVRADITETHVQLVELQKQQTDPRKRNRVGMLMLLHDNPERSLADVARDLECAERSVIRWWREYREGGIDQLLENRHRGRPSQIKTADLEEIRAKISESGLSGLEDIRQLLSEEYGLQYSRSGVWYMLREILGARRNSGWLLLDETEKPEIDPDTAPLDNPAAVVSLLNSLPLTDDVVEWGNGFKKVLHRLLPDVDRISVNVNRSCDIRNPGDYEIGTRIHTALTEDGTLVSPVSVSSHKSHEAPSLRLIEGLRRSGVPLHESYDPTIQDYYLNKSAYLGSIFLWRSRSNPPISHDTLARFESLALFIEFSLSDLVARHQVSQPIAGVFAAATEQMFVDAGFSRTERRIVTLALLGHPYKEIADSMSVTIDAVKKHFQAIFKKTGTRSQAELFAKYFTAQLQRETAQSTT